MTVAELIEKLQSFDDDMEVQFAYPYHDYWHSIVCGNITNIDIEQVKYSEYHRSDKLVDMDEDEEDPDEDTDIRKIVVLR